MTIASRTPEGFPSHCPVCGHATEIEFSDPGHDAPCPCCGELLLLSSQALERYRMHLALLLGVPADQITAETPLFPTLDSISFVESVMAFESDEAGAFAWEQLELMKAKTVGDFLRSRLRQHGNSLE